MTNFDGAPLVGVISDGGSSGPIYRMAQQVVEGWQLPVNARVGDVGGGSGHFAKHLSARYRNVLLVDYDPQACIEGVETRHADLNLLWPVEDESLDALIALEVVEHLENPRHFFREIRRVLRPGAPGLVTTPNQLSLRAKGCLLLRDNFPQFIGNWYPAHISPILPVDLVRASKEAGLAGQKLHYTNVGRLPHFNFDWQQISNRFRGLRFSDNLGIAFIKGPARPGYPKPPT